MPSSDGIAFFVVKINTTYGIVLWVFAIIFLAELY